MGKIVLSENEYGYLTKGLISGVCFGIIIGSILGDIIFFFSVGAFIGIVSSIIFSIARRFKSKTEA